jgi:hypothetical protein
MTEYSNDAIEFVRKLRDEQEDACGWCVRDDLTVVIDHMEGASDLNSTLESLREALDVARDRVCEVRCDLESLEHQAYQMREALDYASDVLYSAMSDLEDLEA